MSIAFECTDPIPINFELYKLKQIFFPSQAPNRLYRLCIISPSAALWNPNSFIHFNFFRYPYTILKKIEKFDIRLI